MLARLSSAVAQTYKSLPSTEEAVFTATYAYNCALAALGLFPDKPTHLATVEGRKLYVSRIPVKSEKKELTDRKIQQVFSFVRPFERKGNKLVQTITPKELGQMGIKAHIYPTNDFTRPTDRHTVKCIQDFLKGEGNGLIHCKAGRGRSAYAVLAIATAPQLLGLENNRGTYEGEMTVDALSGQIKKTYCEMKQKRDHLVLEDPDFTEMAKLFMKLHDIGAFKSADVFKSVSLESFK